MGILLSVYQIYLCGHSDRHQVMDQKSSFFICPRVSARFLHCFCTVSRDAMGTLTCKIRQRMQKLLGGKLRCFAQKQRKLETSKIRVFCPVGSFNQGVRDSNSRGRTKKHQTVLTLSGAFYAVFRLILSIGLKFGNLCVVFCCVRCRYFCTMVKLVWPRISRRLYISPPFSK